MAVAVAVATVVVVVVVLTVAVVCRFGVTVLGKRAGRTTGKITGYYKIHAHVLYRAKEKKKTRFTRLLRIYARARVRAASHPHTHSFTRRLTRNSEKFM